MVRVCEAPASNDVRPLLLHGVIPVQVVVPKTFTKYTSRRVLTTSWIEGEKLSQSTASDVGDLVNIGVICYLKQVGTNLLLCTLMRLHPISVPVDECCVLIFFL